jgi:hypothetical protein
VLTEDEAEDLAMTLLGGEDPATRGQARAIARESSGNPLFVGELVRHVQAGLGLADRPSAGGAVTLDEVLWARVLRLPEDARRLLEVVAVSGRPIGQAEARRAAGLEADERAAWAALRSGHLVRGTGPAERDEVESYHDRIREAVLAHLTPADVQGHHLRLARTLEAAGRVDPEALAAHFLGAGMHERAGQYVAQAAAQAAGALAFDRAAALYRLALELRAADDDAERPLRAKLGDALANAGRGAEAARQYLAASAGANGAETLELRRRAAWQFLISGHVDEGLAILRDVLDAVGMRLPGTPRGALWSLLARRAQLRWRGLHFRPRPADQIPAEDLARIDICWSAAAGLSIIDPVRGADFQARGLLLSLRAGEPHRIARALGMEAAHVACAGAASRPRTATLLQAAEVLAQQVARPDTSGVVLLAKAMAVTLQGHWQETRRFSEPAEAIFRDHCIGVAWELDTAQFFSLWSLMVLGEIAELSRRWPRLVREADERGDLYAAGTLGTLLMAVVRLGADDPEGALQDLQGVTGRWSRQGFHIQHHNIILAELYIALYRGDGRAAWDRVVQVGPTYTRSLLLRVQVIRIEMLRLRALAAMAAAATAADPQPLWRAAEQDARRLDRERVPAASVHARLIRAEVAAVRHDESRARTLLAAAVAGFEALEMRLCAAAARRLLGKLWGGDDGQALIAQADAWMTGQEIRNPARMACLYAMSGP